MKRFWLTICLIMFMTRPGLAQDLPIKKIMIIEGMRSLTYGLYNKIKNHQGPKSPADYVKYLGESIARAVPSAGLKGMAVKIAKQEGMAIVGQLLYVKGDLVNYQRGQGLLTDWRLRYMGVELGTKTPARFNPRYLLDVASTISYGYLTGQNMSLNKKQTFLGGKPIFGKSFKKWHQVSRSAAVLGY